MGSLLWVVKSVRCFFFFSLFVLDLFFSPIAVALLRLIPKINSPSGSIVSDPKLVNVFVDFYSDHYSSAYSSKVWIHCNPINP